jgi:hypothetical protein
MSTPHRATPEQWNDLGAFASDTRACVLELRSRIEALEAVQQQVKQQVSELQTMHNTATDWRMEQDARMRALESPQQPTVKESLTHAPAGSLVERVAARIEYGIDANQDPEGIARSVIRVVASCLRQSDAVIMPSREIPRALEQEASR